ncbi:nucleotidyltransferase family protein [Emticicia sp. BO119]|uniref:nucleotidyltransferase family protein n=1 Tax=Emticicia sp. BO119 TaxID=2757768 RepID=UPI001C69CA0E
MQKSDSNLSALLKTQKINWKRVQKMLEFHSIKPTVYLALKNASAEKIDADFFGQLNREVKVKSAHNIFMVAEIERIKALFNKHQIQAIPYKGLTWSKELYKKIFREGNDMDFLIDKNKVFDALKLLKEDGYRLRHL